MPGFHNNFNEELLPSLSSSHQNYFCPTRPKVLVRMWDNPNPHAVLGPTLKDWVHLLKLDAHTPEARKSAPQTPQRCERARAKRLVSGFHCNVGSPNVVSQQLYSQQLSTGNSLSIHQRENGRIIFHLLLLNTT